MQYVHDGLGRLTRLYSVVGANTRDDFSYGLDAGDNRLYRENNLTTGKDEYYMYDTLNRLTSMDRGDLNAQKDGMSSTAYYQDWDLDQVGNWGLFWNNSATAQTRTHNDVNEISTISGWTTNPSFDAAGNLTRGQINDIELRYDHLNRLTYRYNHHGYYSTYDYDALGRMVEQECGNGTPVYTYTKYYGQTPSDSSSWQLLEEYKDGDGDVYRRYVWGGQYIDEAVRYQRDSDLDGSVDDTLYYDQDGNWNVTALLAADGTVSARYAYTSYGVPTTLDDDWSSGSDASGNPFFYCGYYWDVPGGSSLDLYHVRHRAYSPLLGRWLQRDPIGYVDGMSLYEYVQDNPINSIDFGGLGSNFDWEKIGKDKFKAKIDGAKIRQLSQMVVENNDSWRCIWYIKQGPGGENKSRSLYTPILKSGEMKGQAACGDIYSISNLTAKNGPDPQLMFVANKTENDLPGAGPAGWYTGWRQNFDTGLALGNSLKAVSDQGGRPISAFYLFSHAKNNAAHDLSNGAKQEFGLVHLKEDTGDAFDMAKQKHGPKICWFRVGVKVRFFGCNTSTPALTWAKGIIRSGGNSAYNNERGVAYGTNGWLQVKIPRGGRILTEREHNIIKKDPDSRLVTKPFVSLKELMQLKNGWDTWYGYR